MKKKLISLIILFTCCGTPEPFPQYESGDSFTNTGFFVYPDSVACNESEESNIRGFILLPDGTKKEISSDSISFGNNNTLIAAITSNGTINCKSEGETTVTGTYKSLSMDIPVIVTRPPDYTVLKISEVMYDPLIADAEYIEIYNLGTKPLKLEECSLIDGAKNSTPFHFPKESVIGPCSRIVVSQSSSSFKNSYFKESDYSSFSFSLNNSGESVFLKKGNAEIIDAVYIKGGCAEYTAPADWGGSLPTSAKGNSVHRIDSLDTNKSSDWKEGKASPGE